MKPRINQLYVVRTMAIIAVLLIHATAKPLSELDRSSNSYFIYQLFNTLASFAVPVFIFLSGFVLIYNYMDKEVSFKAVWQFYRKRMLYIVVPYLILSVFYFVFIQWWYYDFTHIPLIIEKFLHAFFIKGGTMYHLYYMYIIVQFYILFPLIWMFFRQRWLSTFAVPIAFVFHWIFVYMNGYLELFPKRSIVCLNYMVYFLIGAYIAIHWETWSRRFNDARLSTKLVSSLIGSWLLLAGAHVFLRYTLSTGQFSTHVKVYELVFVLYCLLSAALLLGLGSIVVRSSMIRLHNAVISIGALSFGIYLIHPLFQQFYRMIDVSSNPIVYHLYIIGGFLLVFLLSWLTSYLVERFIPYSWMLFGAVPNSLPYKQLTNSTRINPKSLTP